jgi:hypothetical protein
MCKGRWLEVEFIGTKLVNGLRVVIDVETVSFEDDSDVKRLSLNIYNVNVVAEGVRKPAFFGVLIFIRCNYKISIITSIRLVDRIEDKYCVNKEH